MSSNSAHVDGVGCRSRGSGLTRRTTAPPSWRPTPTSAPSMGSSTSRRTRAATPRASMGPTQYEATRSARSTSRAARGQRGELDNHQAVDRGRVRGPDLRIWWARMMERRTGSGEELGIATSQIEFPDRPTFVTVTQTVGIDRGHTDVSLWFHHTATVGHELRFGSPGVQGRQMVAGSGSPGPSSPRSSCCSSTRRRCGRPLRWSRRRRRSTSRPPEIREKKHSTRCHFMTADRPSRARLDPPSSGLRAAPPPGQPARPPVDFGRGPSRCPQRSLDCARSPVRQAPNDTNRPARASTVAGSSRRPMARPAGWQTFGRPARRRLPIAGVACRFRPSSSRPRTREPSFDPRLSLWQYRIRVDDTLEQFVAEAQRHPLVELRPMAEAAG